MRTVKLLLVIVIITWGLLALVVRSATPFVDDYRATLEQTFSARLGLPVTIGSIKARWYGLRPLIELRTLYFGEGDQQLVVDRASVDIDPSGVLGLLGAAGRDALVQASRLTIDGLALTIVREPNGRVHVEGFGPVDVPTDAMAALALPRSVQLVNTQISWIDRKAGTPTLAIPDVAILLRRDGRRLALRARLETAAGAADAAAWLDGFLGTTDWSGDSYLHVANLDVARLFAAHLPHYYGLRSLDLNATSWTRWEDATPVHSQGEFSLRRLSLRPTAAVARPLDIKAASAAFSITRESDRLLLGLRGLHVATEQAWPAGDLAMAVTRNADGMVLDLHADYLPLADLRRMVQVRLPWPALRDALDVLEPRGALHELRVQLDSTQPQLAWRGTARIERLALAPWRKSPGVTGISGQLRGRNGLVQLTLRSTDSTLQLQPLFRDPLTLDRLAGTLEFRQDADTWTLRSDRLVADAPHLSTESRITLQQRQQHGLFLDLQTDFRDGDASAASLYYPVGVMGKTKTLVRWLDRAIQRGRVVGGSALFHGPVSGFPFENTRNGMFEVLFDVADVDIDYQPGWPMLESLAARVHFHGNQLDIQGQDGRILDSQITHVEAHIGTLRPASPIEIKGNLTGTLSDILRTLQEDGLRGRFGRFAKGLRGSGETQLDLDFAIPFKQRGDYRLNGILTFADARLTLPDWSFALSKIDGALNFTLDGLSAKGLRARALGSPLSIDVLPISDGATRIRTTAALSTEAIARQLPTLPLQVASGKADFTIGIDIPSRRAPAGSPTMLSVDSPLQGIEIGLPSPLGKPADGRRALALRLPLNDNAVPASLGLGADLSAQFSADGQRVDVAFGGEQARLGPDTGVRISGHLGEVDTAAWHTALSDLAQSGGAQLPPIDVDLQMARIGLPALAIDDARLTLQHRGGEWRGSLESASLAGRFVVPATLPQQPIAVTLDRLALTLPVANDAATPSPAPDPTTAMEPTGLPGLQLTIADMRVNNAALGQLQLDARRSDTGLHLDTLKLEGGALRVDAQGSWTRGANGVTTRIDGSLAAPRLGDLLVDLGYARQLEEAPSDIAIALTWPGDPAQWHPGTIDGSVSLDIGAGRLAEVDPGVTRVVGLLNLNALTRRLRLDFSDFYKKGFSFDRIAGGGRLTDGKAVIDSLVVDGPTGRLDISGSADLLSESLNQQVRVTPNLDATLPIAGAIAGGPIVGIAVLVAQQVMSDTVDEINRFEYAVNGPWAAPKIVQLDTGGTLSRLLKPLRGGITAAEPPTETEPPSAPAGPRAAVQAYDEPQTPEDPAADARNPLRALLDTLNKGETDSENLPIDQD